MKKVIILDFDGVIINSLPIKANGFVEIFKDSLNEKQEEYIRQYHLANGGVNRVEKIKHIYKYLHNKDIDKEMLQVSLLKFSKFIKTNLFNKKHLIQDTYHFLRSNYDKYIFHIASAADEQEVKSLCFLYNINHLFDSIMGSPKTKTNIIRNIISSKNYTTKNVILIGDSKSDQEAAEACNIKFYPYNNSIFEDEINYIHTLKGFKF